MIWGSDSSCPLGGNEDRLPPLNGLLVAESADAYPVFQGAACTDTPTMSFITPLTACHSAIWDPEIIFRDTFTAIGQANILRGEVLLADTSEDRFQLTMKPVHCHPPSCVRTNRSLQYPDRHVKFFETVAAVHNDGSFSAESLHDQDTDAVCLMARAPRIGDSPVSTATDSDLEVHTPSSPQSFAGRLWRSVQVFDMRSNHARGRVQVEPPEATFAEVRRLLGYIYHEIAEIFDISPPPQDLDSVHVRPLLLVRHDDLYFGDDRRAVLVDVELHGDQSDSIVETDRYTIFLPSALHRTFLLRIAGVRHYCEMQSQRCLVWYKGRIIPFQYMGLIHISHGDYLRIAVPPFEEPVVPTHFAVRACQAGFSREQLVDHFRIHGPDEGSLHSEHSIEPNYFLHLIDDEDTIDEGDVQASIANLNRMFDEVQGQVENDLNSLLQASFTAIPAFLNDGLPPTLVAPWSRQSDSDCCPAVFQAIPSFLAPAPFQSTVASTIADVPQCSFTDEFLQAIRARSQAIEAQDEEDMTATDPSALSAQPLFVQHLHAFFEASRPAGRDVGCKVESWYTDHMRRQSCHNARTTFLGPDFHTWEQQLRLEWIDQVDPYHELEFVLVHPMPEDAEEGIYAQLLLIQNPDARQRSIVLTIYDNAYDRGLPHSLALVTVESVNLQSILLITEFQEFCPPELPWSECRLFFGDIEVMPHRSIVAQHGYAFRLHVTRPQEFDVDALRFAADDDIRQTLAQAFADASFFLPQAASSSADPIVRETITPVDALWCPEWHNSLASAFHEINEPDLATLPQFAHVVTWYLNGQYEPHSRYSRTVRISANQADWERTIIAAWADHVDRRFPFYLHFVEPRPPTALGHTYIGRILVVQLPLTNYAAILLSVSSQDSDSTNHPQQIAVYTLNRLSAQSACALVPFPFDPARHVATVRRGSLVFPPLGAPRVGDGDHITVEFSPLSLSDQTPDDDADCLVQVSRPCIVDAEQRFRTIPTFLTLGAEITSCKIDGTHDPPIFTQDRSSDAWPHRLPHETPLPTGLQPMHDAFIQEAVAENEEEGPVAYIDTWYLRGLRPTVTEHSRVLRIDQTFVDWQSHILDLWSDMIDPRLPLELHWVTPTPPSAPRRDRLGHLLIVQDVAAPLVAVHFALHFAGQHQDAVGFAAALLTNPVQFGPTRDLLQLARLCLARRCRLQFRDQVWQHDEARPLQPGSGLAFIAGQPIERVGDDDVLEPIEHAVVLVPDQPFGPALPPLADQSPFVREFHEIWRGHAIDGPGGMEQILQVHTWFLEGGYIRHNDECRAVVLGEDFWVWERALQRRWADLLYPDEDVDYVVVTPAPSTASSPAEIHLILSQRVRAFECPSIVTTYDNGILQGRPYTAAILLPAAVTKEDIIRSTGKSFFCPPQLPTASCVRVSMKARNCCPCCLSKSEWFFVYPYCPSSVAFKFLER